MERVPALKIQVTRETARLVLKRRRVHATMPLPELLRARDPPRGRLPCRGTKNNSFKNNGGNQFQPLKPRRTYVVLGGNCSLASSSREAKFYGCLTVCSSIEPDNRFRGAAHEQIGGSLRSPTVGRLTPRPQCAKRETLHKRQRGAGTLVLISAWFFN